MEEWLKKSRLLEDLESRARTLRATELDAYRLVPESERPPGWGTTMLDEILSMIFRRSACDQASCAMFPSVCKLWNEVAKNERKKMTGTHLPFRSFDVPAPSNESSTMSVRGGLLLMNRRAIRIADGEAVAEYASAFNHDNIANRVSQNGTLLISSSEDPMTDHDPSSCIAWKTADGSPNPRPVNKNGVFNAILHTAFHLEVEQYFIAHMRVNAMNQPGLAIINGRVQRRSDGMLSDSVQFIISSDPMSLKRARDALHTFVASREYCVSVLSNRVCVHSTTREMELANARQHFYYPWKEDYRNVDVQTVRESIAENDVHCAAADDDGSVTLLCSGKTDNTMVRIRLMANKRDVTYEQFETGLEGQLLRGTRDNKAANMWKNVKVHGNLIAFTSSNWCVVMNTRTSKASRFELPSSVDPVFRSCSQIRDTYQHCVSIDTKENIVHIAVANKTRCRVYSLPCDAF